MVTDKKSNKAIEWLTSLTIDDCLVIIKYGLRNEDCPEDITVDDVFNQIGSLYIARSFLNFK